MLENDQWVHKMMCLDSATKYIYDFKVVRKEDFSAETVVEFLKPYVKENNIKVMSADGSEVNKKACKILNIELDLCGFHEMQNFMKLIRGPMRGLNQKIISEGNKIEENNKKINEIKKLRKGKKR